MSSFPFWEERLRSWRAFLDFSEHELEIKERIDLFCVSLGELMGLKSLKFVFATILIYGNEMNKGTIRGNALGFRVDSILKLSSTKATSLKGNLLDFIVRQIRDTYPEALALSTELREISSQIIRITIEMTMGGLIELSQQIKAHADSCEKLRNTISSDDPFHKVIHFFSNGKIRFP
jgi:formin 2